MASPGATSVFVSGVICAALLVWLAVAGCNNTCVFFTSNPPTGKLEIKVSDSKPSCTLTTANGTVRVQVGAVLTSVAPSGPSSIQHIFVTVRAIEAHPSAVADEDSPDWQELAPQLARQPVQVDLMAPRTDPCAPSPFDEGAVPAGVYRQIRLRLVLSHPAAGEPVPEVNACGSASFSCIVRTDGSIQPLAFDGAVPQLRIGTEQIPGGFVHIFPDVSTNLSIEFNASSSLLLPVGDALRLVPRFTVERGARCQGSEELRPQA